MRTLLKLIIVIFIITVLLPSLSFADFEDKIITSLIEHGNQNLNANNINAAINDFSRALLLDIDNDNAIKGLLKTSRYKDLPFKVRISMLQINDMYMYISRLREAINYYSFRIKNSKEKFFADGGSEEMVQAELNKLAALNENINTKSILNPNQQPGTTNDPLLNLIDALISVKKSLEDQLAFLREEYKGVMSVNDKLTLVKNNAILNKSRENNEASGIRPIHSDDLEEGHVDLDSELNHSSTDTAVLMKQLESLKTDLARKDLTIERMTKQVVDMSLQLVENQNKFKEKNVSTVDMHLELTDLNSRLELGQKIIQEKDDQIKILQNDINKIKEIAIFDKNKFNESLLIKNRKLIEQSGILRIYKEQYWDTYKENKSNIANIKTLEAQIDFAQKMIAEKERIINNFKQNMISFDSKLLETNSKLLEISVLYDEKSDKDKIFANEMAGLQKQLDSLREALKTQILEFNNMYSSFASDNITAPKLLLR